MYKVGVFPGKFMPPHRGHLNSIINAATKSKLLYVVVSDHQELTGRLCDEEGLKIMDLKTRAKWLSVELQGFDHIKVVMLDETWVQEYPYEWTKWSNRLKELIPEEFDVIFGGEIEYKEQYTKNFPNVKYEIFDYNRKKYPISAAEIRKAPYENWDYILGSARPFFTKKILISGTESCMKTTISKYLAKIYHTSWTEEVGRYYSDKYLGGNEDVYTVEDFEKIAYLQRELEYNALKTANKVTFFDTGALVTQFYLDMFLNTKSDLVDKFIDPNRYDLVLLFKPDVEWVDDGFRRSSGTKVRENLHTKLKNMYIEYGYGSKIIEISGNYNERLNQATTIVDNLLLNVNKE